MKNMISILLLPFVAAAVVAAPRKMTRAVQVPPVPAGFTAASGVAPAPTLRSYQGPPPLPMTVKAYPVTSDYGNMKMYAGATQPIGQAVIFESSVDLINWTYAGRFPPVQVVQEVYVGVYSYSDKLTMRARAEIVPLSNSFSAASGGVRVNPNLKGMEFGVGAIPR